MCVCARACERLPVHFVVLSLRQETVTKALQQVCSFFPDTISTECRQFVGRYSQEVINLLLQDLNATDICKKLGLCSDTRPVTGTCPWQPQRGCTGDGCRQPVVHSSHPRRISAHLYNGGLSRNNNFCREEAGPVVRERASKPEGVLTS